MSSLEKSSVFEYDHHGEYDTTRTTVTLVVADDSNKGTVWVKTDCIGSGTWWRDVPARVARGWANEVCAGTGYELVLGDRRAHVQGWRYFYTVRPVQ